MNAQVFPLYSFVQVAMEHGRYSIIGQVLSRPIPRGTDTAYMVRMVPGHSGTLEELPASRLVQRVRGPVFVHYARVAGRVLSFPVDMLRYDNAVPVTFVLNHNGVPIAKRGFEDGDMLVAVTTRGRYDHSLTESRWASFGWTCKTSPNAEKVEELP